MSTQEHGGNIYRYPDCLDFSVNLNPLGPPGKVREAILQSLEHLQDYPQTGYGPLKEAIGAYEEVSKQAVICGNGAAELIYTLCQAIRPKKALLPAPTFSEYEQALKSVECRITYVPLRSSDGYQLTGDFFHVLQEDPDLVFLCNPNNPTGLLIPDGLLQEILDVCDARGIWLIVDECFLDFTGSPEEHTLKKQLRTHQKLFLIKAFTKRYAIPGIRLGYGLCGNPKLLERMQSQVQPWNISCLAMAAGIAALRESEYVEEGRQMVSKERVFLQKALSDLGLRVYPSETNYLFFEGPEDLFEACAENGILIRDCSNFHGLKKGFYRAAIRRHPDNQELIRVLTHILRRRDQHGESDYGAGNDVKRGEESAGCRPLPDF